MELCPSIWREEPPLKSTGGSVAYDGLAADADGDKMTYTFEWGDGTYSVFKDVASGTLKTATHTYSEGAIGLRPFKFWADDSKGHNVSKSAIVDVVATLAQFPQRYVSLAGELNFTAVVAASNPHPPAGSAHTIDVVGAVSVAFRLGSAATGGVPSALLDFDAAKSDGINVRINRQGNLITFGGPDVNWVTRYYNDFAPIQTRIDSSGLPFVYVATSGNEYRMVNDYFKGLPVTDYGYDTVLTDAGRQVRIVVGISGFATRGLSDMIASGTVSRGGNRGIVVQLIDNEGDGFYEAYGTADTAL